MRKIIALLALFLAVAVVPASAAVQRIEVPIGNSPSFGPANAPVTIIEFIDFQ